MPSLYGNTTTTYTVTASNVSTLYLGSTSTAITATTYSTNLAGLYGGSYAALPTNAEQLIQLFDNNGNVHFYLDPVTNSATIYANFVGTGTISLGNYQISGDSIINSSNDNINFVTNGLNWYLNNNGTTQFPNYTFPSAHGSAGQVLIDNGSGILAWTTASSTFNLSTVTNQALFTTSSVQFNSVKFGDNTQQTTAWTGTVAASQITSVNTNTIRGLSTIGYTGKLSDGIGQISTSTVSGLSIVGYTNNYNDLSNKPTIPAPFNLSTVTNQALFTTSSVKFGGLQVTNLTTITHIDTLGVPLVLASLTTSTNYRYLNAYGNILHGVNSGNSARITLDTYNNTSTSYSDKSYYSARRARGTIDAPSAPQPGDYLMRMAGYGYGTTGFLSTASAGIDFVAFEPLSDTAAGGQISFDTMVPGYNDVTHQEIIATMDAVNGFSVGLITFNDNSQQTTAWNSVASVSTSQINGLSTIGYTGKLSDGIGSISTSRVSGLSTIGYTGNLSDGIGSLSTSRIAGLSVVGYTNNYNDLSNKPTPFNIGTVTNQALFTTSSVVFNGLQINNLTTITFVTSTSSQAPLFINSSGVSNPPPPATDGYSIWAVGKTGTSAAIALDSYANTPSIGVQYPRFLGRFAHGTASSPTAAQNGDTLLSLRGNGYATTGFNTTASAYLNFVANENFTDTTRGTKFQMYATPVGTQDPTLINTFDPNGSRFYGTYTQSSSVISAVGPGSSANYQGPSNDGYLFWGINKPNTAGRLTIDTYANPNAGGSSLDKTYFTGRRARGSSGSPTAVQSGDTLLRIAAYGYDGTGFVGTASGGITFYAAENFNSGSAGGSIIFDVMELGWNQPAFQFTPLSLDYTNGVSIGNKITFPDSSVQTTAWTGSISTSSVIGLSTIGYTGKLSDGLGQISTSTVAGLSVVGYTNNYNDLSNKPTIPSPFDLSTVTNQALFTTSSVTFNSITATNGLYSVGTYNKTYTDGIVVDYATGNGRVSVGPADQLTFYTGGVANTAMVTMGSGATTMSSALNVVGPITGQSLVITTGTVGIQAISAGGYPLDINGQALISIGNTQSPSLVVSNYTSGLRGGIVTRNWGQNLPGGTSTTSPNPAILMDGARGTPASPTAVQNGDTLGSVSVSGYDGANWSTSTNLAPGQIVWQTTEAFVAGPGGTTNNAGTRYFFRQQPQFVKLTATSRQIVNLTSWSTASNAPPQLNYLVGSGIDGTTPTLTSSDGANNYTGYGRTNFNLINGAFNIFGVTGQDSAPDNSTLTGTNFLSIYSSRQSAVSGRRNAIQSGDTIGGINFAGQTTNSSTSNGLFGARINAYALENFSNSANGTALNFGTVNTGTTTLSSRLTLNDKSNTYVSEGHYFLRNNNAGIQRIALLNTATTFINSDNIQFNGFNNGTLQNIATFTTSSVTLNASNLTVGTSNWSIPTTTGISGTSPQLVGGFDTTQYTTGKFIVSIKDGTNFQSAEVLLLSNGSSTANTVYGIVIIGGSMGSFSSSLSGTIAQLYFTPTGASSMTIKSSLQVI